MEFKVTPEYVSNAATSCDTTATQIAGQLATLKSYVSSLQPSWLGMAADRFQALMVDFDVYARMLHDALTDIGSGLRGNYVNYTQAEEDNIRQLVTVDGAIPGGHQVATGLPGARLG